MKSKFLSKFFYSSLALIAVLILLVFAQPDDFRVSRSKIIHAHPAVVFTEINTLRNWEAWSPWAKLDPNAISTFRGSESGVGSSMSWQGDSNVGAGTMTITESTPHKRIVMRLEFTEPFQGVNTTEFDFVPQGETTEVTWTMFGKNSFFGKVIGLVMDCDQMIGSQFEKGLSTLERLLQR